MPRVRVLSALKCGGVRHAPGSFTEISAAILAALPPGTVELAPDASGLSLVPPAPPAFKHGPTFEEFVEAGYPPARYPPQGYAARPSPGYSAYLEESLKDTQPAVGAPPPAPPAETGASGGAAAQEAGADVADQ